MVKAMDYESSRYYVHFRINTLGKGVNSLILPAIGEESSLPYYLLIAGGRIIGFIPFQRVLVLCEMQSA